MLGKKLQGGSLNLSIKVDWHTDSDFSSMSNWDYNHCCETNNQATLESQTVDLATAAKTNVSKK